MNKKMYSKLTVEDFKFRLINTTKVGNPNFKHLKLFWFYQYDSSKKFYGFYNDSTYDLTLNRLFSKTLYKLKGNYQSNNGKIQVKYQVVPIFKFHFYFFIFFLFLGFCMIGYVNFLIYNSENYKDLMPMNFLFILMLCYAYYRDKEEKKKLEKSFIHFFEIYSDKTVTSNCNKT